MPADGGASGRPLPLSRSVEAAEDVGANAVPAGLQRKTPPRSLVRSRGGGFTRGHGVGRAGCSVEAGLAGVKEIPVLVNNNPRRAVSHARGGEVIGVPAVAGRLQCTSLPRRS